MNLRTGATFALALAIGAAVVKDVLRPKEESRAPAAAQLAVEVRGQAVVTGHSLSNGDSGGQSVVVEFSDYECPYCRKSQPAVDSAVLRGVRVAYIHAPGPSHPKARPAALAAICADEQGRFREVHSELMDSEDWRQTGDWAAVARSARVPDIATFVACLASARASATLERHEQIARSAGIRVTPTFAGPSVTELGMIGADRLVEIGRK